MSKYGISSALRDGPKIAVPGGLNRHSRRAAAAAQPHGIVARPESFVVPAQEVKTYAAYGRFVIDISFEGRRWLIAMSPEAGEQHMRESLEAMEALSPVPAETETERELLAESMAAMALAVVPLERGHELTTKEEFAE